MNMFRGVSAGREESLNCPHRHSGGSRVRREPADHTGNVLRLRCLPAVWGGTAASCPEENGALCHSDPRAARAADLRLHCILCVAGGESCGAGAAQLGGPWQPGWEGEARGTNKPGAFEWRCRWTRSASGEAFCEVCSLCRIV